MCQFEQCGATPRRSFLQRTASAFVLASVGSRGWAEATPPEQNKVHFPTPVGEGRGYLALPDSDPPHTAVLVVHGEIGLPKAHTLTADELAGAGFAALAIERFSRLPGFDWNAMQEDNRGPRRFLTESYALEEDREALGAITFLQSLPAVRKGPVGVVGFCGGGIRAVRLGLFSPAVGAVVSFYGPPLLPEQYKPSKDPIIDLVDVADKIRRPLQVHYGTNDYAVKADDVERLVASARRAGAEVEAFAYADATHAFYDQTNPHAFSPSAAKLAKGRYLDFLRGHLNSHPPG